MKKERVRQRMLLFQKKQILRLRWRDQEFDINNPNKPMKKYNTISQISRAVGVKSSAVAMFLYRFKLDGKLARRRAKTGHTKVPPHVAHFITMTPTLTRYRHMSMQQRCEQIRIDSGGQVDISRTLLLMIYREHNIVRR